MQSKISNRGFITIIAKQHTNENTSRILGESSAIGGYEDSSDNPGSSYLWIGNGHHFDRDEVKTLIDLMQHWLDNKRLPKPVEA